MTRLFARALRGNLTYQMLVISVRLHFESQGTSVQLDADHLRAQAEGRRKFHPAILGSGALDVEDYVAGSLVILEVDADFADAHVANRKRRPVRWDVRSKRDLPSFRIGLQTEHAAQYGTDNHGSGPNLMR